jgi:hypothetical protein
VGAKVWAKLVGWPAWPAKVSRVQSAINIRAKRNLVAGVMP